jgi:glycosyltransferase involved in cell wall biosynthesis
MKVLWIKSDFPLPADTGGKIRTKNLLYQLAKRAEVTFLSYMPSDLGDEYLEEFRTAGIETSVVRRAEEKKSGLSFYWRVFKGLVSSRPYVAQKYVTPELQRRLRKLLTAEKFDLVICDFLEMAWCAPLLEGLPRVLFEHNVETMIWRRHTGIARNPLKKLYLIYEQSRMERFERWACSQFDLVLTVSDEDGNLLRRQFGLEKFLTVPTGVDTDYFRPQEDCEEPDKLILSGSMDWLPNIDAFWWFYRDIFSQVKASVADVRLCVVGRRPPDEICAVGEADSSVEVTGTVTDVRPYVASGELFLVPLRIGGGTRIKIYEAMAMGKCVVATSIGAEGLPITAGEHLVIADGAAAFAEAIRELLQDDLKRTRIAAAGQRLVRERYSWRHAATVLDDGLRALLETSSESRQRTEVKE